MLLGLIKNRYLSFERLGERKVGLEITQASGNSCDPINVDYDRKIRFHDFA